MKLILKSIAISILTLSTLYVGTDINDRLPTHYQAPLIEVIVVRPKPETEFDCLRKNIFFEAASEGEEGMTAVANVVLNRIHDSDFPRTACGVVHQYRQFSWYGHRWNPHLTKYTRSVWQMAGVIAQSALKGTLENNVGECEYFHNATMHPKWADEKEMVSQIGNHIFYKDKISLETL